MFQDELTVAAEHIGEHLRFVINGMADHRISRAMLYAVNCGKRLRGYLVLESARLHDIPETRAIWPASAIEAMHAYSLVHDDLPCMDDDDLRRGQPTVHKQWDDATAVLAGDALQCLAFELAAASQAGPPEVRVDLLQSLAHASGAEGMVMGQAMDMAAETAETPLTLSEISALQAAKTGALIEWAACAGARLAHADPEPLRQYARALGLAFQIADDILDVEGDSATTGKRVGKDAAAGKATFVSLLGLEQARLRASELADAACDALASYGSASDRLRDAARFVVTRDS